MLLAERVGPVFDVNQPGATLEVTFGEVGTQYDQIVLALTMILGPWRMDVFDREVLNHNQFGISRNAPASYQRYIAGLGAQIRPASPSLDRRALFFARVDLDPRPMGMGFTSYTTARSNFPWSPGTTYRVRVELDGIAQEQRLELREAGSVVLEITHPIAYFDPSLTDSGWRLELGAPETDHRDVSPVGSSFRDLLICGVPTGP